MPESAAVKPVVYLLHGDNEFGIAQEIEAFTTQMGDPSIAGMNIARLDGRRANLDQLRNAAYAIPFLAERRLVVLSQPFGSFKSKETQSAFLSLLEGLPESTALFITEGKIDRPEKHWFFRWCEKAGDRVFIRAYDLPKGAAMRDFIRKYARQKGGELTTEAATALVGVVQEDTRMAAQEIEKLLAYVNFSRTVEVEDVDLLTTPVLAVDIFKMVDAIGGRNGRVALQMLHGLLDEQEPLQIFGMITRQFRLLLLASELINTGASTPKIAEALNVKDFIVSKLAAQCRNFSQAQLMQIYRSLLDFDFQVKNGLVEPEAGLEVLVATLSST